MRVFSPTSQFYFYKMEFPFFTEMFPRNIHHPSLYCTSTTRATEHACGIPACIFEHAQKTDAPECATMAEVMFSYFVVEHNLPSAIAGPFYSLVSYMCPDSTIAKAMTCVRTKTTILTRCLTVEGTVPIIARCQYSSQDDRVQTRVGTATRTSAPPFSHGKHK